MLPGNRKTRPKDIGKLKPTASCLLPSADAGDSFGRCLLHTTNMSITHKHTHVYVLIFEHNPDICVYCTFKRSGDVMNAISDTTFLRFPLFIPLSFLRFLNSALLSLSCTRTFLRRLTKSSVIISSCASSVLFF